MSQSPTVNIQIPAQSDFVGVVRLAVSGISSRMNFSIDEIEDIKVAVSERVRMRFSTRMAAGRAPLILHLRCMRKN